jgi:polyisoprenoid-binding protein YceI
MKPLKSLVPLLLISGAALALVAAAPGAVRQSTPPASDAGTYVIDAVHSTVIFKIKHLDLCYFRGRFNRLTGEVNLTEDAAKSSIFLELDTTSVDTANQGRDDHLKGPEFLDVLQFPKATFESTSVKADGDRSVVTGKLELHGETREVTTTVEKVGARDVGERAGGFKVGFEGSMKFDRRDFGIETYGDELLGGEIELTFGIEASRK